MTGGACDVLVVGSLHLDILVRADRLPVLDETARGRSWGMVSGGKGGNQARWAARLGARTAMIGRVGDDDFGKRLLDSLAAAGVDAHAVATDPSAPSGMSVAIVDQNGEYGAVIVSGANLTIPVSEALAAYEAMPAPRIVVMQNEIDEAVNLANARRARQAGALTLLNAAPARALGDGLRGGIDLLVVNRVEAAMMSGRAVETLDDAELAAASLRAAATSVIVTMGSRGAMLREAEVGCRRIAPIAVDAVSAHGAGDCYIGKLAATLASGATLHDAAVAANDVAAAYVSGRLEAPLA